ncbi:hypothetical protein K435DRAFT_862443 [Dendrothele bispora CBS 962.96]|uniref:Uncharacterized protein n=1 Tax=Dendrothele bispora (strain CBS 962.96) TaxID=1314807 RepID=A0A4V4HEV1_DENBC|nr:hypothetical protein K435DRAFT_862443 [Dendrothele bispora CBS 962.96]
MGLPRLEEKLMSWPHHARYEPIELPENIHELIDLSKKQLEKMIDDDSEESEENADEDFAFNRMPKSKRVIDEDRILLYTMNQRHRRPIANTESKRRVLNSTPATELVN